MTTLDFVKGYLDFGWSLIPILPETKTPPIKWKEFQERRATLLEVEGWLKKGWHLAVVTGDISGLLVVDDDRIKHGLKEWNFDSRVIAKTQSGGKHYYFKYDREIHSHCNGQLFIDLKSWHSYCLLPPFHGRKWLKKPSEGLKDLQSIPDEIVRLINSDRKTDAQGNQPPLEMADFVDIPEGQRTDSLHRLACSIFSKLDKDAGLRVLAGVNATYQPPLNKDEFDYQVSRAWEFVQKLKPTETPEDILKFSESGFELPNWKALKTGIPKLDSIFQFVPGFHLIVGAPGIGKGWFATWLIKQFWNWNKEKSVFFSLEMGRYLLTKRLIQQWSNQTEKNFEEGNTARAKKLLSTDVLLVDFLSERKPDYFIKQVDRYYQAGYRVFLFDHFHQVPSAKASNKEASETWGAVFENLRNKYPDIYLIVFAQPNKATYKKVVLQMSDVYESGALIEKADSFLSLSYAEKHEINENSDTLTTDRNRVFWVDKNRLMSSSGVGAKLYFGWDGNFYEKESDAFLTQEPPTDNTRLEGIFGAKFEKQEKQEDLNFGGIK